MRNLFEEEPILMVLIVFAGFLVTIYNVTEIIVAYLRYLR